MESLWIKTEKELIEDSKEIKGNAETEVCIIGGRNNRNYYSILPK